MAELSSAAPDRSLLAMMDEAQQRLQHLEISCRQILSPTSSTNAIPTAAASSPDVKLLQLQVAHLQTQLLATVERREDEDVAFRQAAQYAAAKGVSNGVLHSLFDQANLGKVSELRTYLDSGSIPTRDGLRHWRLDLRNVRNEAGATLLHVAVGVSMAREKVKVKLVHLLVDRVGFDPNVRDVFGQTPLHVAAMGGFQEAVQALLERGADPAAQDRSGLTALSLVRTLSRPPEEVVQTLVEAENAAIRNARSGSASIPLSKAMASALFLKRLSRFVLERYSNAFTRQTTALVNALLEAPEEANIAFDQVLQERVPMLFEVLPACQVVRLDTIFASTLFWDQDFINDLKLEAYGYGLSLVSPGLTNHALFGPTWFGVLSKLIQCLKVEMADPAEGEIDGEVEDTASPRAPSKDGDVVMGEPSDNCDGALMVPPRRKLSISSSSSSLAKDPRTALYYADQTTCVAKTRQMWYYAVLFKASAHAFPGTLALTPESDVAISSEDVSKYFPLEDRLLIGSAEYIAIEYNSQTREIRLDRKYDGKVAATVKAYLTGGGLSRLPPYLAVKRIWEREPGNKYEDQMSSEQELFQDYQFIDPESEYEVAIKLGPIPNGKDARAIVAEWKKTTKQLFVSRECKSGQASCEYYCPQRSGHALCLGTMAVIGQGLAKRILGRPTFSKPLKPRASLQRLQNRFKGSEEWPGSPSSVPPAILATSP
ncbi:hypothetical protein PHYSODRAFT_314963 [Phytophthora sojae]|uniref:Uncharacterized protein n=1 Tax=Phytophthora sojae (strain P6497) TaxID=1094619 RepID=G4ZJ88_PHYSP|nr:hypothetical protein PHYSODRAFT_314963 [Phytophthora sojae]EGZ17752.1 hypothetical protein PHYSODRAFT_314963 [Phytophthora sojae]|eukprot:XP_009526810.1 hypothetical protein PHYSODRAFT_314963 [Phytophthora sojae]